MMRCLHDLAFDDLLAWLKDRGEPSFRARQIFDWAYAKNADTFARMTELPKALRDGLGGAFTIGPLSPAATVDDAETTKLLLAMPGGGQIECVRIAMGRTYTACLSTQVGCAVGCTFCATGQMGCQRNLSSGEIVRQLVTIRAMGGQVSNVVFMGMGEPFHNYDAVVSAVRLMVDKHAFGMSPSRITVSTAGPPRGVRKYAHEGLGTELAVSLNAPDDKLRARLMPGASSWSLADITAACKEFSEATGGQPVTFAYVLIDGVNDLLDHARELSRLLRRQPHHLNVIPLNPVAGTGFRAPPKARASAFVHHCRQFGLNASLRRSKGSDINAACGQLKTRTRRGERSTPTASR